MVAQSWVRPCCMRVPLSLSNCRLRAPRFCDVSCLVCVGCWCLRRDLMAAIAQSLADAAPRGK